MTAFKSPIKNKWVNRGLWLLLGPCLFIASIMSYIVVPGTLEPEVYNPLGEYPVQKVLNEKVGSVSSISVSSPPRAVNIEGTKCNDSDRPVTVRGQYEWRRVDPLGFGTEPQQGTGVRDPGCTTFEFLNDIPDEVIENVNTHGASLWQITGEEVPISPEGIRGEPRVFQTQNFRLVP